jgi:hypothetical protein
MRVIVRKRDDGKLDLLVKHTKQWEGPSVLTRGMTKEQLKAEAKKVIPVTANGGPRGDWDKEPLD